MTTFNLDEAERLANLFESTQEAQSPREATALDNARKAAAQLRAAIAEVRRLRERESKAEAIIRRHEHVYNHEGWRWCAHCQYEPKHGHGPDCPLAEWLKGAEDAH